MQVWAQRAHYLACNSMQGRVCTIPKGRYGPIGPGPDLKVGTHLKVGLGKTSGLRALGPVTWT